MSDDDVDFETKVGYELLSENPELLTRTVAGWSAQGYEPGEVSEMPDERTWTVWVWCALSGDVGPDEVRARCAAAGITYGGTRVEHVFADTDVHDEQGVIKAGVTPAGEVSVRVRLRGEGEEGWLLVRLWPSCNHGITICPDCARSWEIDYEVLYADTTAGRALVASLPPARG